MSVTSLRTPEAEPAIVLTDIHKRFRGGRDHVLKGINISFPKGKLTYVLGPSGTGKSVLMKHILGLMRPDSGTISVFGRNPQSLHGRDLVEYRSLFGMLFQNSALFDDFTIFENVAFPLREHTKLSEKAITEEVTKTLTMLGMPSSHDKLPNEISGGMRKRVALARAIIRKPEVLLYDEPTTGLDPVTRGTVEELIAQIKHDLNLTSIVISHDIPSALLLADHIAFLHSGKIAFFGDADGFWKSKDNIIQSFLNAELHTLSAFENRGPRS